MSRRTIALGRKRKPSCFLGAIVFAMIFVSCSGSEPLLPESRGTQPESRVAQPERRVTQPESRVTKPERRVTKPKRKVTKPKGSSAMPEIFSSRPAWVNSCPKEKDYKVYGCGSGETEEKSRDNALQDLVNKINHIAKNFRIDEKCHTRYDSTKEYGQKSITLCDFYSQITTEHSFRGLKTTPKYSEGDTYYTMQIWDTAPLTEQAISLLKDHDDPCIPQDQEESVWEKTFFAMWVQEEIGCRPKWKLREDADKQWYLRVASKRILVEFQSEKESFIPYSKIRDLTLKLHRPDRYEEVEGYYLEVKNRIEGYLYLFKIDQNGQALKIPIVKNDRKARPALRLYPPDASEEKGCTLGSEAPTDVKDDSFKEFFIVALCEKRTRTGDISNIGELTQTRIGDRSNIKKPTQGSYSIIPLFDKIKSCAISTASHTTGAIQVSSTSTCEHY